MPVRGGPALLAHVKANECACEVKNPAGRCCLGNVSKAIQKAQRLVRAGRANAPVNAEPALAGQVT